MRFISLALIHSVSFFFIMSIYPKVSYSVETQTFTVLTRGTTRPIAYFDGYGHLTGFDIELLREIEKRNPSIHFEFKTMSLSTAFTALDNKEGDLIANQMSKTAERQKKYIFPTELNYYRFTRLAVRENDLNITNLADLEGKTVIVTSTSDTATFLQQYIEDHNMQVRVLYTDNGVDEGLRAVSNGRADATLTYTFTTVSSRKYLNFAVKLVGPVVRSEPTFFIFRKSPEMEELANTVSATIKELRADGTLKALSEKFFEKDYTVLPK